MRYDMNYIYKSLVAGLMSVGVVYLFEFVDIKYNQRKCRAVCFAFFDFDIAKFVKFISIIETPFVAPISTSDINVVCRMFS